MRTMSWQVAMIHLIKGYAQVVYRDSMRWIIQLLLHQLNAVYVSMG
jgi:hypothetical protein